MSHKIPEKAEAVQGVFFDRFPPPRIAEQRQEIARLEEERDRLRRRLELLKARERGRVGTR
jgi:hypothetical protein